MKKTIKGVLIVEGLHDKNVIESFYNVDFVLTNGFAINKDELIYLNSLPSSTPIYILTDPDISGDKIRENLHSKLKRYVDLIVDIKMCNKHNKHGVAECDRNELVKTLENNVKFYENIEFSNKILEDLGVFGQINTNEIINKISNAYSLGKATKYNLALRLNNMGISIDSLKRTISKNDYR